MVKFLYNLEMQTWSLKLQTESVIARNETSRLPAHLEFLSTPALGPDLEGTLTKALVKFSQHKSGHRNVQSVSLL